MDRPRPRRRPAQTELPKEIRRLTEELAREVHDVWARGRRAEGWRWGPRRDDSKKLHPNLVSYDRLSEADKDYDRSTALGTIRAILSRGYRIERGGPAEAAAGSGPAEAAAQGERILRQGEPLLAYDHLSAALKLSPKDVRLRQLMALALARSGAPEPANALLLELVREGRRDEETLGLLARTHKDLAALAGDSARGRRHLARALALYRKAYRSHRGYYSGINAASLALMLGDRESARRTAAEVRGICLALEGGGSDYWAQATLGEAALIAGDLRGAEAYYARAAALAGERLSDVASMRRQARLLLARLGRSDAGVDRALRVPPVVMYSPRRGAARSPAEARAGIRARLDRIGKAVGYARPDTPDGLIFLEELAARGCEIQAVLSYPVAKAGARLAAVLKKASKVYVATEHATRGTAEGDRYARLLLTGLARLRAQALGSELLTMELPGPSSKAAGAPAPGAGPFPQEIKALLFADAVGFSKLLEEQIPLFVSHFLATVAELADRSAHRPLLKNTWGDAIYFVFSDTESAGLFALDLSEQLRTTAWERFGLPKGISMRIALHAGPVFVCPDPVIKRRNYVGSHVSRAARIEPVTPPGLVYASQAFAALAAACGSTRLRCEYVGQTILPKKYGVLPLYHVRRAGGPARG